jgi:hypothetical protein
MPTMPSDRTGDTTYGFSRMDRDGRIAAGDVGPVLEWSTGTRLAAVYRGHSVVLSPSADGQVILRGSWHLRLPAAIRHWSRLTPGIGVLLAADPSRGELVVYPPAVLDEMTAWLNAAEDGRQP